MNPEARAHGRTGARAALRSLALLVAVPLCACALVPAVAVGQVGNDPQASPYKDLTTHQGFSLLVGHFAGVTGQAGVGARPGLMLGTRLQVRLAAAIDLWATVGEVWSSRMRIDAGGDTAKVIGTMPVRLVLADLSLVLNMTGDKMWHRLAPYAALGLGVTTPSGKKIVDPGGFELGTNFTMVPTIGTRWFVSRSLAVRIEARDYYYRYTYPLAYFAVTRPFTGHADGSPVLPLSAPERQSSHNLTLWIGMTYGFTF